MIVHDRANVLVRLLAGRQSHNLSVVCNCFCCAAWQQVNTALAILRIDTGTAMRVHVSHSNTTQRVIVVGYEMFPYDADGD